ERDPFGPASAGGEGEQYAYHRHDHRQHQQKPTACRHLIQDWRWMRHQGSVGSVPARADEPGSGRVSSARIIELPRWPLASFASPALAMESRSEAEPVDSNRRSSSATAKAVAEKATTTPVMT